MKLSNINQVEDFLNAVEKAEHDVFLKSPEGDIYNLKSKFSRYLAMGNLLGEHGDEMELFCRNRNDEILFFKFLRDHPEV